MRPLGNFYGNKIKIVTISTLVMAGAILVAATLIGTMH